VCVCAARACQLEDVCLPLACRRQLAAGRHTERSTHTGTEGTAKQTHVCRHTPLHRKTRWKDAMLSISILCVAIMISYHHCNLIRFLYVDTCVFSTSVAAECRPFRSCIFDCIVQLSLFPNLFPLYGSFSTLLFCRILTMLLFCLNMQFEVEFVAHLDPIHLPAGHLNVVFGAVLAVLARAVEEVLCFQQTLSVLGHVQVVHVGHSQLLSLRNLTQGMELDPLETKRQDLDGEKKS